MRLNPTPALALALACLLAAAFQPAGASSSTVTSPYYGDSSLSANIHDSCKELDASSTGTVTATCNQAGSSDDHVNKVSTSIDVSAKVVCTGTLAENNVKIAIGGTANSSWEPAGWDVGVHQGKDYWLGAVCEHNTGMVTSARSYVNLSGSSGLQNSSGSLAWR